MIFRSDFIERKQACIERRFRRSNDGSEKGTKKVLSGRAGARIVRFALEPDPPRTVERLIRHCPDTQARAPDGGRTLIASGW